MPAEALDGGYKSGHYGIETVAYHAGILVTCRVPDAYCGGIYGELIVEDTKTGVRLTLHRHEGTHLPKAIRKALRSASEALEIVHADRVIGAAVRIPVDSDAVALARGSILNKYH